MSAVCRSGGQRQLLAAGALLVLVLVLVRLGSLELPQTPLVTAVTPTEDEEPAMVDVTAAVALRQVCRHMSHARGGLAPGVRQAMAEVCQQLGNVAPPQASEKGCRKAISYDAIGRLGNLMGLYAIIYSLGRMYGATGYVESGMWSKLHKYFPDISLQSIEDAPASASWEDISYSEAQAKLACRPGEGAEPRYFRITDWPARNGIDVFHPFKAEMRNEFTFSVALQSEAQEFLLRARGGRSSVTYIGFHVRRTDFEKYVREKYNRTLPDTEYFDRALGYYRRRFSDALFIVCSDDIDFVTSCCYSYAK